MKKYVLGLLPIFLLGCDKKSDNDKSYESFIKETLKNSEGSSKLEIEENLKLVEREYDILKNELGLIENYEEGILEAKEKGKPILLWFSKLNRVNTGIIKPNFLIQNKIIFQTLKESYITVRIFVDPMQKEEKWRKFQQEMYNSSIQPYYYILDKEGKQITNGMDIEEAKLRLEDELIKHNIRK